MLNHPESTADLMSSPNHVTEIDFRELEDGTLVELVQDFNDPNRTLLAVWNGSEVQFIDRLERDGQVLIPVPRDNEILRGIRLPKDAKPYNSVQELLSSLESFIAQSIGVGKKYVSVLADFALSTWFVDRLSVAPYLSVIGLPQSGKTTLLRLLSLICRRSLLISDITPASFYRACSRFTPTFLIDEMRTESTNRALGHILRSGSTRDVLAVRGNRTFQSYGAKVLGWLEAPDDAALNSRCIVIPMVETHNASLFKTDEPSVMLMADQLRAQLLRFRFDHYKTIQAAPVTGDDALRPRTRDLFRALAAAHRQDTERSQRLLEFFKSGQAIPAEPLGTEQNAVFRALFSIIHVREDFVSIRTGDFTKHVNVCLQKAGEKLRLHPRKVGAVLTSLGIVSCKRTNSGWSISLTQQNAEKLHQLAARYGLDGASIDLREISSGKCGLCRAAGLG